MNFQTISQTLIVWLTVIRETFVEAGLSTPEQHRAVSNQAFCERQDGHPVAAAH